jgi:hypothetical protein
MIFSKLNSLRLDGALESSHVLDRKQGCLDKNEE